MSDAYIWVGILVCITQSSSMSGLNLAVFKLSRLRLEVAAESDDPVAKKIIKLRRDANFTLTTILWANVALNVLLTLLAESVMTGVLAFMFSTVVITIVAEILPQAYFSRHAMKAVSYLLPVLKFYQFLLWPVAKPSALVLDRLVGEEGIPWFKEEELTEMLRYHAQKGTTDVGHVEATGAINFLELDDLPVKKKGEPVEPSTILNISYRGLEPVFPDFERKPDDPFIQQIASSGKKWIILTDDQQHPRHVINSHEFLRETLFGPEDFDPLTLCHRPLITSNPELPLGTIIGGLRVDADKPGDDVIDVDIILLWSDTDKRIITGSDILGRLLRKVVKNSPPE
jgi:metal transporter CNNM